MNNINFVSIEVKCPLCGKSLMDKETKVDNESSIKLIIKHEGKRGFIYLSSIYGSYNYLSDIDIPENEIAEFNCCHCHKELKSGEFCRDCDADIITLTLDMRGRVSFCSRRGCKNHNIGFEDLSEALKRLYQEFGYRDRSYPDDILIKSKEIKPVKTKEEEHKEIIETGSFLISYCPHCRKTLIEDDLLKLKIINDKGEEGFIMLSPYLNVFSSKSTIYLSEDKAVKNIICFHCDKSLIVDGNSCDKCHSSVARIMIGARTKMIDFYICSKKGCTWHGLSKYDMEDIRLDDSLEW